MSWFGKKKYKKLESDLDLGETSSNSPKGKGKSKSGTKRQTWITVVATLCSLVMLFGFLRTVAERGLLAREFTQGSVYVPDFTNTPDVEYYDLGRYTGDKEGWRSGDHIVFCCPLRDAAEHLPRFFQILGKMTYPHNLIDLTFLVSDSKDNTMGVLKEELEKLQSNKDKNKRFGNIEIFEKDFGQVIGQSFSDRHGFAAQGPRRKLMGRARNWLGSVALKPYHSWVYWRDVDVEVIPDTIMEDLMHHDKDVIVPNVWRPLPDWLGNIQPYDLNSWKESEGGLQLAESLDEDAVIVEGYPEYATWRPHLAYMRDPSGDPEVEMELDGIGGVSILSKARVFRTGSHFPAFSFEKHAETEAFGKLSRKMGYSVVGLPNYVVWHIYEPSLDDLKHMKWMADEEERILEEQKIKAFYDRIWEIGFEDVRSSWEKDFHNILKNSDLKNSGLNLNGKPVAGDSTVVDWSEDEETDYVENTGAQDLSEEEISKNKDSIEGDKSTTPEEDEKLEQEALQAAEHLNVGKKKTAQVADSNVADSNVADSNVDTGKDDNEEVWDMLGSLDAFE